MATRRFCSAPRVSVTKSLDRTAHTVQTLVTFPEWDQQGDWVQPDGIQWITTPKVDWEHGIPIGWATIEPQPLEHGGKTWSVPVGTTHFAQRESDLRNVDLCEYGRRGQVVGRYDPAECCRVAEQIFELVAIEEANGVSVEFEPNPNYTRRIGKSVHPQSGRYPSAYYRCRGLGYAHCVEPVSFNARVLKSLSGTPSQLLVIAESGKLAGSPLRPMIQKSLSKYLTLAKQRPASGRVEKAMPPDDQSALPLPPDTQPEPAPMEPEGEPSRGRPSIEVGLDVAQGIKDLLAAAEEKLAMSDDPKAIAAYRKLHSDLEACAEDYAALSGKHEAKLASIDGGEEPKDDDPDADPDGEPEPVETDDEGAIKTKSMYKPLRFKFVGKGKPLAAVNDDADDADDADLERRVQRLQRTVRREARDLRAMQTNYQPTGR